MDNALLHASVHYPVDKIKERINFALSHARLYLAESDDDSAKYKRAWHKAKVIRSSILSPGEFPDACSISLSIALNYK